MSPNDTPDDSVPFRCAISVEAERVVVAVYSDIDIASVHGFRSALDRAIVVGKPVVLDLTACHYLDSTGISTLVGARSANAPLSVIASRQAARLFEIVGLTKLLNVTLAQA